MKPGNFGCQSLNTCYVSQGLRIILSPCKHAEVTRGPALCLPSRRPSNSSTIFSSELSWQQSLWQGVEHIRHCRDNQRVAECHYERPGQSCEHSINSLAQKICLNSQAGRSHVPTLFTCPKPFSRNWFANSMPPMHVVHLNDLCCGCQEGSTRRTRTALCSVLG